MWESLPRTGMLVMWTDCVECSVLQMQADSDQYFVLRMQAVGVYLYCQLDEKCLLLLGCQSVGMQLGCLTVGM